VRVDREIQRLLQSDEQWQLLRRLTPFDRAHHLRVYQLLVKSGHSDPDLLRAALLHDIGKADEAGRAHIGHRTMRVLLHLVGRRWLHRLATQRGAGPRHGLYLALHHARLGASLALAAGATERCCDLIARHERRDVLNDPLLTALIAADEGAIR
jgi:putative nucleotidyltransferase with HDIG domain